MGTYLPAITSDITSNDTKLDCWLDHLVVFNFKSYRGRHVIGPFKRLTGVIGPNGAGKSNLMDAMSFVLGLQARHMRGSSLIDLIYRPSSTDTDGSTNRPSEANVTLVLGIGSGDTITEKRFTRRIVLHPKGTCTATVQVDNQVVSLTAYRDSLRDYNILLKARSFLIFQGDVVEVAQRTPEELSMLFEQISGADALRDDILRLGMDVRRLATEIKAQTLQCQRFISQRSDLERQMQEVEAYRNLEGNVNVARSTVVAFKLFVNEVEAEKTRERLDAAATTLETLERKRQDMQQSLRQLDAELLNVRSQRDVVERERSELKEKCHHLDVQSERAKEAIGFITTRQQEVNSLLEQEAAAQSRTSERRQQLVKELENIREKLSALESSFASAKAQYVSATTLSPEEKGRLETLRQQAATAAAGFKLSTLAAESKQKLLDLQLTEYQAEIQDLENKLRQQEEHLSHSMEYISGITQQTTTDQTTLEAKQLELQTTQDAIQTLNGEQAQLAQRQKMLELQMAQHTCQREEATKRLQNPKLIRELQNAFNTDGHIRVMGTVSDLCRPTNHKYGHAIYAALGRFWDCIVVDTYSTAKNAVKYLKSRKAGVREFASLDRMNAKVLPDHRLRKFVAQKSSDMGSSAARGVQVAIDCIEYAPEYSSLMQCALQDTIITETLQEAQKLAFSDRSLPGRRRGDANGLRFTFVTLHGEKILKNGNIVVNSHVSAATSFSPVRTALESNGSTASDLAAVLHEQLTNVQSQLKTNERELQNLERHASELKTHILPRLQIQIEQREQRLQLWMSRRDKAQEQIESVRTALQLRRQKHEALENIEMPACLKKLEEARREIETIEEAVFEPLTPELETSTRLTFKHIRESEEQFTRYEKEYRKEETQYNSRRTKLECELQHVTATLEKNQASLATHQEELSQLNQQLKTTQKELETLKGQRDALSINVTDVESRFKRLNADVERNAAVLKQQRQALRHIHEQTTKEELDIQHQKTNAEKLLRDTTEVLKNAILERIPLPLTVSELQCYCRFLSLQGCEGSTLESVRPEFTAAATGSEDMPPSIFSRSHSGNNELPTFRYGTILTTELVQAGRSSDPELVRATECRLEEKLGSLKSQLAKRHPNLKASDKYQHTLDEINNLEKIISQLKSEKDTVERELTALRRERGRRFMDCFRHTQNAVETMYHRLTGGDGDDTLGGHAFLELADGGQSLMGHRIDQSSWGPSSLQTAVLFNVIPPSKRFSNLRRLSGGEKTIAALALLFALHSYQPSPFFVLDEIDADLDPKNICFLAKFIRDADFQVVIISHSDRVFSQSDQLIGVYVDPAEESSAVLSLDLSQYPHYMSVPLTGVAAG